MVECTNLYLYTYCYRHVHLPVFVYIYIRATSIDFLLLFTLLLFAAYRSVVTSKYS